MRKQAHAVERPYVITFLATGTSYPLSSVEVQRLLDEYPLLEAKENLVVLRADDGAKCWIAPATLGGGPAFTFTDDAEIDCTACDGDGWYYIGDWSQGYPKGRCRVCNGTGRMRQH